LSEAPASMTAFAEKLVQALLMAAGMAWQVGWSLVLGFTISGLIQALVSQEKMRSTLGRDGFREVALATAYGAASSSCSYASAAITKTLIAKGAGILPAFAFLFSSTNLVIELGIVLYLLMGWQFTAGEWVGGLVLIAIMSGIVKLFYPRAILAEARVKAGEAVATMDHGGGDDDERGLWERLRDPQTFIVVAQNVAMDASMLWKDLVLGFLIAGFLAAFVPDDAWHTLFLAHASPAVKLVADAFIGPIVAIFSFVCSIGNVPLAAVLWSSGVGFGGVLAFLYADLIVLPLLDTYRRFFGWRMAAYMGVVFFITMALAGIVMDLAFNALHIVPIAPSHIRDRIETFAIDYTFWLNLAFLALAAWLWYVNRKNPMMHDSPCHMHGGHDHE
jgi:uncharacterized protein